MEHPAFDFGGMREQNSNGGTTSVRLWRDGGAKLKRWNIQRLTLDGWRSKTQTLEQPAFDFGGMKEQKSNDGTASVRLWRDEGAKLKRWNIQRLTLEGWRSKTQTVEQPAFDFGRMEEQNSNGGTTSV